MAADGIEVTQSADHLIVVNKTIRLVYATLTCFLLLEMLLMLSFPWIDQWVVPHHNIPRPALLPSVIASYQSGFWIFAIPLSLLIFCWYFFTLYLSRGTVVLDKNSEIIKAGGRVRSLAEIASIQTNKWQADALGRQQVVQINWKDDTLRPFWYRVIMRIGAKSSILGAFRLEANADKVAAAIAEFANVPVQHRTH